MRVSDIFEADHSVAKTVWRKRGEHLVRGERITRAEDDVPVRKTIEVKPDAE